MNFLEANEFDTDKMREQVEANTDEDDRCEAYYVMAAYEIIDLLNVELSRLRKVEEDGMNYAEHINELGVISSDLH